jgi:hypothetical protein
MAEFHTQWSARLVRGLVLVETSAGATSAWSLGADATLNVETLFTDGGQWPPPAEPSLAGLVLTARAGPTARNLWMDEHADGPIGDALRGMLNP